jgi:nitroreductase
MFDCLKRIKKEILLQKGYLSEAYHFWRLTVKYNASHHTDDDIQKMQYTLSRETHTIEKGMSMRNPRKGFGQQKVTNLIKRLGIYCDRYLMQDKFFLEYPLSTVKNYIDYTHKTGVDIPQIESSFNTLLSKAGFDTVSGKAGVMVETKENILSKCNKDFESLLYSRHSIRYFSEEPVSDEIIAKALELAQRTPSACNRQGWLTHVFRSPQSIDLIKWQGGSRGFEDEIRCAILVTANLKAFLNHEVHQAYIDGGLFAMNLINALHSLGVGTIPLSCGFTYSRLSKLRNFGIPEFEVPIVIIGVGNLLKEFNVAVSERKDISKTNQNHF